MGDYADMDLLPEGTQQEIVRYSVTGVSEFAKEMEEKGLNKPKVSLQFELSTSGITSLIKAEAAVEEIVIVEEEVEVDDDDEEEVADADADAETEKVDEKKESEVSTEEKTEDTETEKEDAEVIEEKPKKKKTKKVEKEKKKVHKRTLKIDSYFVGKVQPYSDVTKEESVEKLQELDRKDRERIMLEESRNKVESYIYFIKNKMSDDEEEIAKVTNEEQRSSIIKMATEAEDWLYEDGYDADLATFEDKYAELSEPAQAIFFRLAEMTARPEAVAALRKKLTKVEDLMAKWETEKPQVTEEERVSVFEKVEEARKWISDKEDLQASTEPTETPVFASEEVPLQTKSIETLVARLSRKPKPKPKEEPKNETTSDDEEEKEEEESTGSNDEASEEAPAEASEEKVDEPETEDDATGDEEL